MLNLPSLQTIIDRQRADIKATLPTSDPYQATSILNALAVADGGRIAEVNEQLKFIQRDTLATTAIDDALLNIGTVYGMSLNPATNASGFIVITGTAGSVIPAASNIQSSTGIAYRTINSVTLAAQTVAISTLTRSGTTATATTTGNHGLASGMTVIISGAGQSEYNISAVITVTGLDTFQYTVSGSPATPATGTIIGSYTGSPAEILSTVTGLDSNVAGGSTMTMTAVIAGVNSTVYVQYSGIDGGSNIETIEEFRTRLLYRIQNPITPFNEAKIILQAKDIPGVTRVWVFEPDDVTTTVTPSSIASIATGYIKVTFAAAHNLLDGMSITVSGASVAGFNGTHRILVISSTEVLYYVAGLSGSASGTLVVNYSNVQLGQVRILFVRDDDPSIIPSSLEVTTVKNKILEIKPANTSSLDVIVSAPTEKATDFAFTSISPDTAVMRDSIAANLQSLFYATGVGETITQDQYRTAIQNSYDSETGQILRSFVLTSLTGDLTSNYNEILTLGDITY